MRGTKIMLALLGAFALGGLAMAQSGPPQCEGATIGYVFGTDVGDAGETFGQMNADLADNTIEDLRRQSEAEDFPSENASARAAWNDQLEDQNTSVRAQLEECMALP